VNQENAKKARDSRAKAYWESLETHERDELLATFNAEGLNNFDAESQILGKILMDNTAFTLVPGYLKPEHFFEPVHQMIYGDIMRLIPAGRDCNVVTLKTQYDAEEMLDDIGGAKYLVQLISTSIPLISIKETASVIYDLAQRRELHKKLMEIRDELVSPKGLRKDFNEVRDQCMDKLINIESSNGNKSIVRIASVHEQVITDMDKGDDPDSTGLQCLDDILEGGFIPKKFYSLSAPPKKGKTMLMTTIFSNQIEMFNNEYEKRRKKHEAGVLPAAPRHRQVLYICAEMGQKEIDHRVIGRSIGYNSSAFYTRRHDGDFFSSVMDYRHKNKDSSGLFYDSPGIRFDELKSVVMQSIRRFNISGFFLDYFGLVRPPQGARIRSTVEFQEEVADYIASMCKANNIWCCTAQQINREGNVRGGDALPMYVDAHLMLDRSEKNNAAWITNKAIRYTDRRSAGSRDNPTLFMRKEGPHFVDWDARDDAYTPAYNQYDLENVAL
jgi:replicative DNA helicase